MKKQYEVIYEDNHLIAVNKAAGLLVQTDDKGTPALEDMIKDYIKEKYQKEGAAFCGVIHRIDRPVSGLVLLARTSKALIRMNEQFSEREIQKTYWAIVGEPPQEMEGKLIHWIEKDDDKNMVRAYNKAKGKAKIAELDYKIIGRIGKNTLLEVKPYSGRPHQIRVQLAKMGCPIVGDVKYGFSLPNHDKSICLHARRLDFLHPVRKEPVHLEASLPKVSFWQGFQQF